jgi:hypothetical protein
MSCTASHKTHCSKIIFNDNIPNYVVQYKRSCYSGGSKKTLPAAMMVAVLLVSVTAVKWTIDGD